MNHEQLRELRKVGTFGETFHPSLHDLSEFTPRTLLYGYDVDRNSFHIYADDVGDIILHVYNYNTTLRVQNLTKEGFSTEHLIQGVPNAIVPNKRLYPQYCDFEFCRYLKQIGAELTFTAYEEPTERPAFTGPYYAAFANQVPEYRRAITPVTA
jgi:hypothetical protein